MKIDYLYSPDSTVHAINNEIEGMALQAGVLCLISCRESTIRIADDNHSFLVEIPKEFRSSHERVKVFNALLNILDHEQIQLPSANQG
jgi:hypothetical protein